MDKKLGSNQKIALGIAGAIFITSVVLVALGKIDGASWVTFADSFGRWVIGIALGFSAAIKVAKAIKGSP
jgi:hypothetical protein